MRHGHSARLALGLTLAALLAGACATQRSGSQIEHGDPVAVAPEQAPLPLRAPRPASDVTTDAARRARAAFWSAFRSESYDALPGVIRLLNLAVLEDPRDAETVLLLGHAHLWRVAERARISPPDPSVTEHLVLAEHYFEEAYRLAPNDHRIIGWLGSVRVPLAAIRQDSVRGAEGARLLQEGVHRHPAFNLFTAAFTRASLPASDPRFQAGLDMLWRNVDACSGVRSASVDSTAGIYELARRADRACANSEKAAHNFEGFVLHLGDMLVKAGEADRALATYARARTSPTFDSWPYRATLEARIRDVAGNAARARSGQPVPSLSGSTYACAACHAQR